MKNSKIHILTEKIIINKGKNCDWKPEIFKYSEHQRKRLRVWKREKLTKKIKIRKQKVTVPKSREAITVGVFDHWDLTAASVVVPSKDLSFTGVGITILSFLDLKPNWNFITESGFLCREETQEPISQTNKQKKELSSFQFIITQKKKKKFPSDRFRKWKDRVK